MIGEPHERRGETRVRTLWQNAEAAYLRGAYGEAGDLWHEILEECDRRFYLLGDVRLARSVSRRLANLEKTRATIADYKKGRAERHAGVMRIAVYTSLVGGYDSVKIPENPDPRFDYILFSDQPISGGGVWQVRPSPLICCCDARASRFVKMHPHVLLPDYDIAIYIDSNIMLIGDLARPLATFMNMDASLGAVQHPFRENIYQEIEACIAYRKDAPAAMVAQVKPYYREGFTHSDLVEANLLFFKLSDQKLTKFLSRWWAEMERGSKRDQLSFNYAAARSGVAWDYVLDRQFTPRTHPAFAHVDHDRGHGIAQDLINAIGEAPVDPYTTGAPSLAAPAPERASLILLAQGDVSELLGTLRSLRQAAGSMQLAVTILCDASFTESLKAQTQRDDSPLSISIDESGTNLSCLNAAVAAAQDDLVFILMGGVTFAPDALSNMARAVLGTPGAGLVSPLFGGTASIPMIGVMQAMPRTPSVSGACFGLLKRAFQKIRGFDEEFSLKSGWDVDFSIRAADAGFHAIIATQACVAIADADIANEDIFLARRMLAGRHGLRRIIRAGVSLRRAPLTKKFAATANGPGSRLPQPTALRRGAAKSSASNRNQKDCN